MSTKYKTKITEVSQMYWRPQIGNQWILTAAQCTTTKYDMVHMAVKGHDIDAEHHQEMTVEKVFSHEDFHRDYNYMKEGPRNDFALLKLLDVSSMFTDI